MSQKKNKNPEINNGMDFVTYLNSLDKKILTIIDFKKEYYGRNINFVLVEGKNDYDFFLDTEFRKKYKNKNHYINIEEIRGFLKEKEGSRNNKKIIKKTIEASPLLRNLKSNKIYGIIDRDFEEEYPILNSRTANSLFSNDTHDLETLILSTDEKITSRIQQKFKIGDLNKDLYNKALYMAYQIGCVKFCIWESSTYLEYNKNPHKFDEYFENNELNIKNYIDYLLSFYKNKSIIDYKSIVKQLKKKGKIGIDGKFSESLDVFVKKFPEDMWEIISGHDVCHCLRFLLKKSFKFNYENIEDLLVENYDMDMFRKSKLYNKIKLAGLIN